jgi:hypothetical protein
MSAEPRKRLGELLLDAGVIDAAQLQAALGHQRQWGARLGQALVDLKLVAEADIVQALSRKYGYEVARLEALQPYALQQALRLVPREFAVRNNVLPMGADTGSITVAMSDPTNLSVVDELRFRTGRRVRICVGGDREIAGAVRQHYPSEHVLEAIALDLDADDTPGEQVLDPFGGGSKDALEAFFGSGPAPGVTPRVAPAQAAAPGAPAQPPIAPRTPPGAAVRPGVATSVPARPPSPSGVPAPPPPRPVTARPAPVTADPVASPPQPGPSPRPHGADLELEDAQTSPEAVGLARAALLGAVPPGGLAEPEDAWHAHAQPARVTQAAAARPAAQPQRPQPTEPQPEQPVSRQQVQPTRHQPPQPQPQRQPQALHHPQLHQPQPQQQAEHPSRQPEPPQQPGTAIQFSTRDRAVLDALDRLASGAHAEPELLKPAQAMAAVIRLLIRRGIVTEREFLDELRRQ